MLGLPQLAPPFVGPRIPEIMPSWEDTSAHAVPKRNLRFWVPCHATSGRTTRAQGRHAAAGGKLGQAQHLLGVLTMSKELVYGYDQTNTHACLM
ncbi:hypothetical protein KSZ_29280 [Dictyobacter formicarum]|uniref:Uncharacterized protein n=1 Tax=Dictyobacter formicarum TaxID=2778368 RepID=A0ABQ3VG68_9CHLR|nr:hypothetical protein KSZ_29280 [Dictyobacter formicarum]